MSENITHVPTEQGQNFIKGDWVKSKYSDDINFLGTDQQGNGYKAQITIENGTVDYIFSSELYHNNPVFVDVVEKKCESLPGGEKFKEAFQDIKKLNQIYGKLHKNYPNADLDIEEIFFLYQLHKPIKDVTPIVTNAWSANKCIEDLTKYRDKLNDFNKLNDLKDKEKATLYLIQPLIEECKDTKIKLHYKEIKEEPDSKIWNFIKEFGGDETAEQMCQLCTNLRISDLFTEKQKNDFWKFIEKRGKENTFKFLDAVLSYDKWQDPSARPIASQAAEKIKDKIKK